MSVNVFNRTLLKYAAFYYSEICLYLTKFTLLIISVYKMHMKYKQ